jgi:hypothetical protein
MHFLAQPHMFMHLVDDLVPAYMWLSLNLEISIRGYRLVVHQFVISSVAIFISSH